MYKHIFKPLFDWTGSLVLLIVLSPVMLIVAGLVYINMQMPILFRQERPGKDKKLFTIYKFRTMKNASDRQADNDEQRLTRLGKTLRSMSLDELPQLINVLKGDMSFIGPRPLLVEYLELYNDEQAKRHEVRPGISGWAQVNGRNNISWEQKFKYDVWYTENISFILDLKIILLTIRKILSRKDISAPEHATSEKFNGHN